MADRFTLRSTELREPWVRTCEVIGRVDDRAEHTRIHVSLDEPLPGHIYGRVEPIERLVLAPRHVGYTLYPKVAPLPCCVHVCLPRDGGSWERGPFLIADWGELSIG